MEAIHKYIPINEIITINRNSGRHFFEQSTMRFFKSRTQEYGIELDNYIYFITSEQFDYDHKHLYTIRVMCKYCGAVEEIGGFQNYETMQKAKTGLNQALAQAVKPWTDTFHHGRYETKWVNGDPPRSKEVE